MQNKILVIGSSGQLASSLQEITDSSYYFLGRADLDICDKSMLADTIKKLTPKLIINCSAYTNVDGAESDKVRAYALNSAALEGLASLCKKHRIPLIHISTDYVFDGKKMAPYAESDKANPQSVYGASKFEGEERIRTHLDKHIIIRTSWLFSKYGSNFVKTMIRLAGESDELSVVSDQTGCPTSAHNLSIVITQIANKILAGEGVLYGTYHYSDQPSVSWHQFAAEIFQHLEKAPKLKAITSDEYNTKVERPMNSVLNCTKLYEQFGIKQMNWIESLKEHMREVE